MKNFGRAVRLALRRRITVLGVFLSSLLVAFFWGANVGAVYPFIEAVFHGDSMHEWVDGQMEQALTHSKELRASIHQMKRGLEETPESERRRAEREIAFQQDRLKAEEKALAMANWMRPYIYRYLPGDPFQTLICVVAAVLTGTALKGLFLMINAVLVARLSNLASIDLRKRFFRHTLQMDMAAAGRGRVGDMMSRFTADVGAIIAGITVVFGKTLGEPLKMLVCIVGAALISWRLLVVSMLVTPAAFLLMYVLAKSIKRANRRVLEEMALFYQRLGESLSGIQLVKAYTLEPLVRNRFHEKLKQLYHKSMRLAVYGSLTRVNTELLGVGVICLAILAGGHLVLSQQTHLLGIRITERPLSFGSLMVFYGFLIGISDPARKLADVFNRLQAAAAASDRVYAMLDREPAITDPVHPHAFPQEGLNLVFDHVHFHYRPDEPVLKDIDFQLPFGETLAIVGPNGCGKTTIVNLMLRFYDPVRGVIRLNGVALRDLRLRDLRRGIGLVTQQTLLFDDTIMNNIRFGSLQATDAEVIEAAKKAHIHSFIEETLKDGYEANAGEWGGRLSGGQQQRIALARAIIRDPAILILDEATSQIDVESEQLIHETLRRFKAGRTSIIVTHRLSTLTLADRIMVMDAGRIVDLGSHDELLERCEVYQHLYHIGLRKSA